MAMAGVRDRPCWRRLLWGTTQLERSTTNQTRARCRR
jgi:hypothetical protein